MSHSSPRPVTALRSRMIEDMMVRGFTEETRTDYGLLASATCKTNIARARELIAVPVPVIDPPAEHDDADPAAGVAADYLPPCPCCGGRMIIVETFERCGAPRGPPPPDTGVRTAMP